MNPCQLSFGEAPHIAFVGGLWQAIGLLTVTGRDYTDTFRVFVSGETEALVQEFITAQEFGCSIHLEVTPAATGVEGELSGGAYDSPARVETPSEFVFAHSQLNIGISRQDIQTPLPYRIIYRVEMTYPSGADYNMGMVSFDYPAEPQPGDPLKKSVSFEMSEAQVRCQVKQGAVSVRLEENTGDGKPKVHGPVEVKEPAECWLPEKRTIPLADCAEKKWQVIVEGLKSGTECYISYVRREG